MDDLRIILIGAYPPPYGGVSVHIQRLQDHLLNNGFSCTVVDFSYSRKDAQNVVNARDPESWRCIGSRDIVHFHSSGIDFKKSSTFLLLSMLCKIRKSRFIVTFHSLRSNSRASERFNKIMLNLCLKFGSHYIAVSSAIRDKLISLDVDSSGISVIPAFFPPMIKQQDIDVISQNVWYFIRNHWPIISANAFRLCFYNAQDLYGVDMCIELCAKLREIYPEIGFILCLSEIGDSEYYDKLRKRIVKEGLVRHFSFLTQACHFYPIMMKSDLFVRPTNTDGDAISVREALYFKIPALTSDAVPRPEGVVLFKNRDINDFASKTKAVLSNLGLCKRKLKMMNADDQFAEIMSVYQISKSHIGQQHKCASWRSPSNLLSQQNSK